MADALTAALARTGARTLTASRIGRLPPSDRRQLPRHRPAAGDVVALDEGLQVGVPGRIELHARRGELTHPVAEGLNELESVAEIAARIDPAVVVLKLGDRNALAGEQLPCPPQYC